MHYQAYSEEMVRDGVQKFGVAGGARVMMSNEYLHAEEAIQSGIYITYSCPAKKSECFRAGSNSKCFCGHLFKEHNKVIGSKKINTSCLTCPCKSFMYVPTRPEEVGMWWLPRRKEFDVRTWSAKCKCKHSHEDHNPTRPFRCKACSNCHDFIGSCITCDMAWHDHEMLYEKEHERYMEKKPIGEAYYPLAEHKDIQQAVFDPALANKPNPYMRPRPKDALNAAPKKPAITQGGTSSKTQDVEESKVNVFKPSYPTTKPLSSQKVGVKPTMSKIGGTSSVGGMSKPISASKTTSNNMAYNRPSTDAKPPSKLNFKPTFD